MYKIIPWIKSIGFTYFLIYLSSVITGILYFIYISIIWFDGDIWAFYTFLLYLIWSIITSILSLIIYKIIFMIWFLKKIEIPPYILVLSLVILWVIQIGIWGYGNQLFIQGTLSKYSIIEFWFYNNEGFLLLMHATYYLLMGIILKCKKVNP